MDAIKILDNFIDEQTCNHMIQVYDRLFQNSIATHDGRKLIRNTTDSEVLDFLKVYIPKVSEELGDRYYVRDLLLSIYEPGAYLEPHIDFIEKSFRNSLGVLFYLNDNFTGGEIYFVNFSYSYSPQKGSVLIFPCNQNRYKHGVQEVTSGIRYTMPVEITTIESQKVYEL